MDKQYASLASQLAVSIVWDLGLHMPPPERPATFSMDTNALGLSHGPSGKERTIEEQRAVLGTFVITSMSVCFHLLQTTLVLTTNKVYFFIHYVSD